VIARDMTEEKSIQARLIQAQRLESLGTLPAALPTSSTISTRS